jgi:hypothetical protein
VAVRRSGAANTCSVVDDGCAGRSATVMPVAITAATIAAAAAKTAARQGVLRDVAGMTVNGQGNNLNVNNVGVVCGGVPTANATVYMIDTV